MKATHNPLEHVKECFARANAAEAPKRFHVMYAECSDALYCVCTPDSMTPDKPKTVKSVAFYHGD